MDFSLVLEGGFDLVIGGFDIDYWLFPFSMLEIESLSKSHLVSRIGWALGYF